ncbi:MAG: hypothetical protein HC910_22780 [Spirulinaceae cyanobacterium SM2_1_0]|nr:hypothetical protein [Spirulinaceae cyanobacterium SM2_1_0]
MNVLTILAGLPFATILRAISAVRVFIADVNKSNADGKITIDEWYDLAVGLVLAIGDIFELQIPVPTQKQFEDEGHGDKAADARSRIVSEINASLREAGIAR